MLTLDGVQVLTSGEVPLTPELTITVEAGNVAALMGPNGCGKSLLTKAALGVLLPPTDFITRGHVALSDSVDVGYVPQQSGLLAWRRVDPNIRLPSAFHTTDGASRLDDLYSIFHLKDKREHLPHRLSGGFKVRAAICRALSTNPDLLAMDEPTRELDEAGQLALISEIKKARNRGAGVWIVSHELSFILSVADVCVVLAGAQAEPRHIQQTDRAWSEEGLSAVLVDALAELSKTGS